MRWWSEPVPRWEHSAFPRIRLSLACVDLLVINGWSSHRHRLYPHFRSVDAPIIIIYYVARARHAPPLSWKGMCLPGMLSRRLPSFKVRTLQWIILPRPFPSRRSPLQKIWRAEAWQSCTQLYAPSTESMTYLTFRTTFRSPMQPTRFCPPRRWPWRSDG